MGRLHTDCAGWFNAGEENELERLRLQLRHVEGELATVHGQAPGIDVNLAHVDDVIALKTQVANLLAELESERHAAREVGTHPFLLLVFGVFGVFEAFFLSVWWQHLF